MDLTVLPLAITMMLGPQIMSDIIFVTAPKPVRISLAFVAGVAIAATVGVIIMRFVASLFGISIPLGDPSDAFSIGNLIQYALVNPTDRPGHQELGEARDDRASSVAG